MFIGQSLKVYMDYEDFFDLGEHVPGQVTLDEMICAYMRRDIRFRNDKDALEYYKRAQSVLRDQALTGYQYLKDHGLLEDFHEYSNG